MREGGALPFSQRRNGRGWSGAAMAQASEESPLGGP
jgi:hypothetical protein